MNTEKTYVVVLDGTVIIGFGDRAVAERFAAGMPGATVEERDDD